MTNFETPGLYILPPLDTTIQARFDEQQHPLFGELNSALDARGVGHRQSAGTCFNPRFGGDSFFLSEVVAEYAQKLAVVGEHELAVEVLDKGVVWPETQIHGVHYQDLATDAAENDKSNLAVAIALDNNRLLAGTGAKHFDEVYQGDDKTYRMAQFAKRWLSSAVPVFEVVLESDLDQNNAGLNLLSAKVDLYSEVLAAKSNESGFPRSEHSDTNWSSFAVSIGQVCHSLYRAGETERAQRLESLDPEVITYSR